MTKNELVRDLAEELEIPRRDIAGIIEALLEKMTGVLKAGDKVQLTPFGQFKIRDRAARVARNPQTGAKKAAPARKKAAGTSRKGAAPARKAAPLRKASSGKAKR